MRLLMIALMVTGSVSAEPKPKEDKNALKPGDVVLEAETFRLTDCDKITDTNASAGAAIQISKETSAAEGEVMLPTGTYRIEAYVMCEDLSHDTFWLEVGATKLKVFPSHARLPQKTWSRAGAESPDVKGPYKLEVKEAKPTPVRIAAKETGMKVDRLVFLSQPPGVTK